jgi:hypothetical protein
MGAIVINGSIGLEMRANSYSCHARCKYSLINFNQGKEIDSNPIVLLAMESKVGDG